MNNKIATAVTLLIELTIMFFQFNCTNGVNRDVILIREKDLVPESLVVDDRSGTIYIGSTYKRKIIRIESDGKISDFIPQEYEGIWSPLGIKLDKRNNLLWLNTSHANEVMPLIHPDTSNDWMTNVTSIDIKNKKIVKKYSPGNLKAFFNDLVILPGGDIYITESVNNKIYKIDHLNDSLKIFLEPAGFTFLNGITYSRKNNLLFVSSQQGIIKIDLLTNQYSILDVAEGINAKSIDGLHFYKNFLIGHQSSKISRFYLNQDESKIVKAELLDSGKEFDSSTNGAIANGYYYYIVNSQIGSAIDTKNNSIKPVSLLKDIIIRKIKL